MGICSSCLGRDRASDEDDSSRLLFDDPHAINYGSFGEQNPGIPQADPQDTQRESEALQTIVAQTSNHLVDIFAMVSQNLQRSPATNYSGQEARLAQYQDVMSKLSSEDLYENFSEPAIVSSRQDADWPSDDEDDEETSPKSPRITKPDVGPLLGGFADMERGAK